jgi:SAM-dependent methyltransferase
VHYVEPYLSDFGKEIESCSVVGRDRNVREYYIYLRWPIRKLEYSFVLSNSLGILQKRSTVLDCGCGVTPLSRVFASLGHRTFAVDSDPDVIRLMKMKSGISDPRVSYDCQDIARLEFSDDAFDLVTSVSVLEHLESGYDTKAIAEMLRVLKDEGILLFTVDFFPNPSVSYLARKAAQMIFARHFQQLSSSIYLSLDHEARGYERYHVRDVKRYIVDPFKDYMRASEMPTVPSLEEVQDFWKEHWFEGCLYDRACGRNYVSFGFLLKKTSS